MQNISATGISFFCKTSELNDDVEHHRVKSLINLNVLVVQSRFALEALTVYKQNFHFSFHQQELGLDLETIGFIFMNESHDKHASLTRKPMSS